MSIYFTVILGLLVMHYVGDFLLQTHWMAANKSSDLTALALHVSTYTATFFLGLAVFYPMTAQTLILYTLANGIAHFGVDFFSSKASAYYWKRGEWHNFFCVVGFDQLLHMLTLVLTWIWIVGV